MTRTTGRARRRETRTLVKVTDALARVCITTAGVGSILAVSTVFVFLLLVVRPLFTAGSVEEAAALPVAAPAGDPAPVHAAVDEYGVLGWTCFEDGTLQVFRPDTGRVLRTQRLFEEQQPSSWTFDARRSHAVFGFPDGTIRYGTFHFATTFLSYGEVPEGHRTLQVGGREELEEGMGERTPLGQFRLQRLEVELEDPLDLEVGGLPVVLVDVSMQASGPVYASMTSDGVLRIHAVREIRNLITRGVRRILSGGALRIEEVDRRGLPQRLLLEGRADSVFLVWEDGHCVRLDTRDRAAPAVAETVDLLEGAGVEHGVRVTSLGFMIGKTTLVVGDSRGRVTTWFRVRPELPPEPGPEAALPTSDGSVLARVHDFEGTGSPVTAQAASHRTRMLLVGYADGRCRLFYLTSSRWLAEMRVLAEGDAVRFAAMAPKDDAFLAGSVSSAAVWRVAMPHPQVTPASIFGRVWYEGYAGPRHVWQSSSGSDEFEPKYGLVPLIFGTLKATFYTLLFAVPIALLAALYTSEFLHPRSRARIKPAIEMMASLPSVVLGFLAALVLAPVVEHVVTGVLAAFVVVPFSLLAGGFLWQLLPQDAWTRWSRYRFLLAGATVAAGALLALGLLGAPVERVLFGGDIRAWLAWSPDAADPGADSPFRSPVGGWMVLLAPLGALLATVVMTLVANPVLRGRFRNAGRPRLALLDLARFSLGTALAASVAWAGAHLLAGSLHGLWSFDPRGSLEVLSVDLSMMGTYIQRNALIVGFIMGFAVVPIIYTIAEDALSSVPDHLRAASLGAGATPWQTALRLIVPTAMSGLFSAVMIGLGRAVGETMIVLMAAGNTPILEMNMFSGFRTLAANIAVELPEAAQGGTNYRMLFLAALVLFVMTFLVNTVAEAVRLRFRKRAYQL